jgi:hypothetical protein
MMPNQKIQDGSYKMNAFFNDGSKNSLGLFELVVRNGIPHALVSVVPTTAGEEKIWKVLDANQLEPAQIGGANYFCRQMLYLPSDLKSMWQELYGHVRPFVHTEGNGMRFVAAGNRVFYSDPKGKPWKYVADFLKFFAEQTLGRGWILDEIKKPEKEQHQIVKFHWALHGQLHKAVKDEQGEYGILPCGSSNYFYNLAYDLFVLQDNGVLFDGWLHRLKIKKEFQGVRHEIFAAATCIRAGFKITPDQAEKPTEFIATHISTGLQIAVEAKSRQRKDVLGAEIGGNLTKAEIIPLLNRALKKTVSQPYVIFIDLNLPYSPEPPFKKKWFQEIHGSILPELGDSSPTERDKFNMVVFTNHPWHYGENNQPSPPLEPGMCLVSKYPEMELTNGMVLNDLMKAVQQFGNIPKAFPITAQ